MNIKLSNLDEREFIKLYINMYNLLMPANQQVVSSEIDVITEFALLDSKFSHQRFSSLAKDKVIESASKLGWKLTKLNINNKLYSLLDKKFLRRDEDKVIYLPKHLLTSLESFRKNKEFKVEILFNGNK